MIGNVKLRDDCSAFTMNEIDRNFPGCPDYSDQSFLGLLHDQRQWSDIEYQRLDAELYILAAKYRDSENLPRELVWRAMRIFSHAMLLIGCHFDSNDDCRISNISNEELYKRRERLQLVFEGFFMGVMPSPSIFEYNPQI